jgi:YesN/AraC family two-component response regulator
MASILVVDDEESVRNLLCELLEDQYTCHVAGTAEEAQKQLSEENYDVVITDISMPGMSGLELLGHIRQAQPDTPVIIISGISDLDYVKGLVEMGAFHYLMKPFQLEAAEETVARALEYRAQLQRERQDSGLSGAWASPDDRSHQELMELEHEWVRGYLERDASVFERIWGEDFALTNPFGEIKGKRQAIESLTSNINFEFFSPYDVHGNVFSDTAVVTGRALIKGEYEGRVLNGQFRYTNTFAKREAGWQAIASHMSRIETL